MDTTVIIIQSKSDNTTSIPEKLNDVGKQLTKLMYNSPKTNLSGKSIIVVFPNTPSSMPTTSGRIARDEAQSLDKNIVSLQNSIRHIVRHASLHGIDVKIHENLDT